MPEGRAPCIAVVGPANSGKTTFLHLLDRALQGLPPEEAPLAYVVKGNPDGTGRYLYQAPGLREELKPRVKGRWGPGTVEAICRWIDGCRDTLELHRPERWTLEDLDTVGGMAPKLEERIRAGGPVTLGGVAPVWAYTAALHRVLDLDPGAAVLVFDPKLRPSLVTIPVGRNPEALDPASPLARGLSVRWSPDALPEGTALDVTLQGGDRILPPECIHDLPRVPFPPGPVPEGPLVVYGSLPTWLALTYSRFLRQLAPGQPIGQWDASTRQVVFVHAARAPR